SAGKATFFDANGGKVKEITSTWTDGGEGISIMDAKNHIFLHADESGKALSANINLNGTNCVLDKEGIFMQTKQGGKFIDTTGKEKEKRIKEVVQYLKEEISNTKGHNMDYADKISALLDELLSKNGLN
ncbi:hypothetical protein IKA92_02740, partial [bacterium]|nr:hypothetical protein [bacterium]